MRAIEERGLRVLSESGDLEVHPKTIASLEGAGPFDVIFLGVKAHGLTQLAPQLKPLIGDATTVVSTQNGIPWWYCHLERVDPGGVIAASIDRRAWWVRWSIWVPRLWSRA